MDQSTLMYVLIFAGHVIVTSLILAVFTSVFINNKKRGFLFLTVYSLISVLVLSDGFNHSTALGIGLLINYLGLGIVTYFVIKKRSARSV